MFTTEETGPTPHMPPPAGAPLQLPTDPPGGGSRVPTWLVVLAVVGLVVLLVQMASLRSQVGDLERQVQDLQGRAQPAPPLATPATPAPPMDLPPPDAEAARRQISDAYTAVFSPGTPPELWSALVLEPADLGPRLQALGAGPCAGAAVVLTDIRFTSDDSAVVTFRFTGSGLAAADTITFAGGARRVDGAWRVTGSSVQSVLDTAADFCAGG